MYIFYLHIFQSWTVCFSMIKALMFGYESLKRNVWKELPKGTWNCLFWTTLGLKNPTVLLVAKNCLNNSISKKVNISFVKRLCICIWILSGAYAICSMRLDSIGWNGLRVSIEGTYWICVWRNSSLQHFWIQRWYRSILLIKAQHQKPKLHTSLFASVLNYLQGVF